MLTGNKVDFLGIEKVEECKCDLCCKLTSEVECFGSSLREIISNIDNTSKCFIDLSLTTDILEHKPTEKFHICYECFEPFMVEFHNLLDKYFTKNDK